MSDLSIISHISFAKLANDKSLVIENYELAYAGTKGVA
jgi:hypothetical protein